MRSIHWTALALLLLGSAVGCDQTTTEPAASNSTSSDSVQPAESTVGEAPAQQVEVDIKSWDEIQQWVASQQGKVVVIDVWSTWCVTCIKEFPHFVDLHNELSSEVACASLNIDYYGGDDETPQDVKPRVLKFLESKQASMRNFISSTPDEEVIEQIKTAAIPAALVYDRDGKLHTIFNNDLDAYGPEGFNYEEDITPLVKQLLFAK